MRSPRRSWRQLGSLALTAPLLLVAAPAAASDAVVVDTSPSWDGSSGYRPFGAPDTATFGQVITAPTAAPRLREFTFTLKLNHATAFIGHVYAWDASQQRATGNDLWAGTVRRTTGLTWQQVTLHPGGLALAPGQQYVVFISVSELQGRTAFTGYVANPGFDDVYPGGDAFWQNSRFDPSAWTTRGWLQNVPGSDLVFRAVFGPP